MRLDPKYFNLFIVICAILTVAVIFYGSISYHQKQSETLRENIEERELGEYYLTFISNSDSLRVADLKGAPVILDFWATWSGRSQNVHQTIADLMNLNPELVVLAAVVRDDDDMAREYEYQKEYNFKYVYGSDLYHKLMVPGVPTQILIDREGQFFDFQVGEDEDRLREKVQALVSQ